MEHTGRIIDKGKQTFIPFNDLELNPHNTYEAVDIEDLAGSISAVGQISPLSVIGPSENTGSSQGSVDILLLRS